VISKFLNVSCGFTLISLTFLKGGVWEKAGPLIKRDMIIKIIKKRGRLILMLSRFFNVGLCKIFEPGIFRYKS